MKFFDACSLALRSLRSNRLRPAITISIIAFGIMALIGIITAIGAMTQKLTESFSTMGANGFTIRFKERNLRFGNQREQQKVVKKTRRTERISSIGHPITEGEAETFKRNFNFPGAVSISSFAGNRNTVRYNKRKTTPNVFVFGADENYLNLNGFELDYGRNFTGQELDHAVHVCIIGADVAKKLFPQKPSLVLQHNVRINHVTCRVIGILSSRGSAFGFSRDNFVLLGYRALSRSFRESSFMIGVKANDLRQVQDAMGEAEGLFRSIRKLSPSNENNFVLDRSNSLADKAMKSLRLLTLSVTVIGLITLIGAAIGLMNIMLVAVAERTREIGVIKAIGAKRRSIHIQFIMEAIFICVVGAVIGIVIGIAVGNLFAMFLHTSFVLPWPWVIYGIVICTIVGLTAGIYPAVKAGRLNPIEALRYE